MRQFCTFYLDELCFGIDVLQVQEVIRFQEMTIVPTAPRVISGLINLRGQIVTALNLRMRLGLPGQLPAQCMNVIVHSSDGPVSLLVDEVGDVIEIADAHYEAVPSHLPQTIRNLMQGVYKLEKGLMLILNTEKTIELETQAGRN